MAKEETKNTSHIGKKYKILLVEDDKFLSGMYASKFNSAGHDVSVSGSADEALSKIKDGFAPDIIACDIIMPGLSGLEFLKVLRDEKLISQTPIVMLTNQSDSSDMDKAMTLGAAGYIIKSTKIPSEVVEEVIKIAEKTKK